MSVADKSHWTCDGCGECLTFDYGKQPHDWSQYVMVTPPGADYSAGHSIGVFCDPCACRILDEAQRRVTP